MDINATMSRYVREGRFKTLPGAMVYVERTLWDGRLRRGLVGMADLTAYDYEPGSDALIRATEGVVMSRIPPRIAVRKKAGSARADRAAATWSSCLPPSSQPFTWPPCSIRSKS